MDMLHSAKMQVILLKNQAQQLKELLWMGSAHEAFL